MAKPQETEQRLVVENLWVRPCKDDMAQESALDAYRVTCLLSSCYGAWSIHVQLHKVDGSRSGGKKFNTALVGPRSRHAKALAEDVAKEEALKRVIECVSSVLASKFGMSRRTKLAIFGGVYWKDGANFRFR